LDKEGTVYEIKNNKKMQGASAWMLMCSIIIASLGLDLNSPAVIIGAMLISPLMSPILGVGLAMGTNDFDTLRISMRHFLVAIAIALVTSTIYFYLTPLGEQTPEILSRTKPSLLDVLIAFFGGIAGIISITRKDKSNAIPGVAIATALMPPLCVTGWGIANWNFTVFVNSFYLFFLNSFFVAIATYVIVRLLKFPFLVRLDASGRKWKSALMILFSLVTIIPSVIILRDIYQGMQTNTQIDHFLSDYFGDKMLYVDSQQYIRGDSVNRLVLKVYGNEINSENIAEYEAQLALAGITNTKLEIIPTSEIDLVKFSALEAQVTSFERINRQLEETKKAKTQNEIIIDSLQTELIRLQSDTIPFVQISKELKVIFPDLLSVGFANAQTSDFQTVDQSKPILLIRWAANKPRSTFQASEEKILLFMQERMQNDDLELISHR
jgi:uncharacterized hydrophobic protein (TIGR00271 family)